MRKSLLIAVSMVLIGKAYGQVEDVSVVITPKIGYQWFDKKSTVENGTFYGLQAGFGFGKIIELRGIYERSLNLKQNFGKYESDIQQHFPNFNFEDRSIDVQRIGGEFKANLPIQGFSPYFVLGTGVQTFKRDVGESDSYKNENLYGSGGIGLKFDLGNRASFNIEGTGIVYNMNPGSLLYNPGGTSEFDDWINSQDRNRMFNWSLMAGLQFYLGGRNEEDLTDLDKAYLRRFSGGISGTKVTLSPAGSYVKFNNNSAFRDTYMLGGILGIDFSNYVGLQGYYYQSTQNEKISLDFDKMAMYGADFVGKLNVPRGIVPYISIGGGYLQASDKYQGKPMLGTDGTIAGYQPTQSGYYAKGGAGVAIPLSSYVQVFGGVNVLYSMQDQDQDMAQIREVSDLSRHTMYTTGLRFNFGKSAQTEKYTDRAFDKRFAEERSEYDQRIQSLEQDLKEAYRNNDTDKAMKIMEEKRNVDSKKSNEKSEKGLVRMTPAELEKLIEKVLDGVDKKDEGSVEDRLKNLEYLLLLNNQQRSTQAPVALDPNRTPDQLNQALLDEIKSLNRQLQDQQNSIESLRQGVSQANSGVQQPVIVDNQGQPSRVETQHSKGMNFLGFSPFIGLNFGNASSFNLGARGYYGFEKTPILFVPEAYIAVGDGGGFGASANAIYPFRSHDSKLSPYAGLGLGIHALGGDFDLNTNVLGGVAYKMGSGSLTADYTIRGAFKNNQVAVGYRFKF